MPEYTWADQPWLYSGIVTTQESFLLVFEQHMLGQVSHFGLVMYFLSVSAS